MEKFVVSARKYRPATFDSVVGQQHITTTLINAINNNHLAQAFLFCGPRGVGKTTCARILAKTINCTNRTESGEACGQCESCQSFQNNASFNVHELDAASNNSVDDIRNLVDQVRYAPQSGQYKVYIIDEVHMLSNQAFNAFLKTLEEPPSYAIFILATTEKHKIIPTILSRCQIFDFNRITVGDMTSHLINIAAKENIEAEEEALHLIAQKADGALRDALSIFDLVCTFAAGEKVTYKSTVDNLHVLDYDYYFKLTSLCLEGNHTEVLLTFDEILRKGFDGHNFIVGFAEHVRNLMVSRDTATTKLLEVSESVQAKFATQAKEAPLSFLLSALNLLSNCDQTFKGAKNQRLHVELCLMKLAHLNKAISLGRASAVIEKKKSELKAKRGAKQPAPTAAASTPTYAEPTPSPVPVAKDAESPVYSQQPTPQSRPSVNRAVSAPVGAVKKAGGLPSLADLKARIDQKKNTPKEDIQAQQAASHQPKLQNRAFTAEDVKQVWSFFAEDLRRQDNQTALSVMAQQWELNGTTITLRLSSVLQVDLLEKFRVDLVQFLKTKLDNGNLRLETVIVEGESKKMIYTPKEKYIHLMEKYPTLDELREKLNLDFDM
ncbi:DNA polymerase III subunit gamma/tau [Persicobacter sp. CCB-QB2]|uniref:DNA polymerase III subunit gamma/tau n=1 Tax=Persicobacter sp. CCB-QB2 TaxID=1561025 RepID=UPI0006A9D855|nr:DNA polymerase III subunit gamma/tau [Persicobacter sp. CCB-QB2]